jgi:hypothetical protein
MLNFAEVVSELPVASNAIPVKDVATLERA